REFLQMLDELFREQWPERTPKDQDPFRRIYVHGWPFALKALALAYHRSRIDVLGPLAAAIGSEQDIPNPQILPQDKFRMQLEAKRQEMHIEPEVPFEELKDRLRQIDWH